MFVLNVSANLCFVTRLLRPLILLQAIEPITQPGRSPVFFKYFMGSIKGDLDNTFVMHHGHKCRLEL